MTCAPQPYSTNGMQGACSRPVSVLSSAGLRTRPPTALSGASATSSTKAKRSLLPRLSIANAISLSRHGPDVHPPTPPALRGTTSRQRESLLPPRSKPTALKNHRSFQDLRPPRIDLSDPPRPGDPDMAQQTPRTSLIQSSPSIKSITRRFSSTNLLELPLTPSAGNSSFGASFSSLDNSSIVDKVAFFDSISRSKNASPSSVRRLSRRRSALLDEYRAFEGREKSPDKMNEYSSNNAPMPPIRETGLLSPPQSSEPPSTLRFLDNQAQGLREARVNNSPGRFRKPLRSKFPGAQLRLKPKGTVTLHKHATSTSSSSSPGRSPPVVELPRMVQSPSVALYHTPAEGSTDRPSLSPPMHFGSSGRSHAISPTISSELKVRKKVGGGLTPSSSLRSLGSGTRSPRSCAFARGSDAGSPPYGSLRGAIKTAFTPPLSPEASRPRGILEGLFAIPYADGALTNFMGPRAEMHFSPEEEKENLAPPRSSSTLASQDHLSIATMIEANNIPQRSSCPPSREECLQLGTELRRLMAGDRECLSMLKTCT